jgi:predicted nuclease of restriction endonuclease-like (RecB) superfamily
MGRKGGEPQKLKRRSAKTSDLLPKGYEELLGQLKERIRTAQLRAALAVNRELVFLYWQIGREILLRQEHEGWGSKVVDRLAADLRRAFPDMTGFSPRNLKYMRSFAQAWPDAAIVQQAAAQIPWFHNCTLLDKVKSAEERLWYVRAAVENGWSRSVLVHWIESDLYQRQGKAQTNFEKTLPALQSDLARETLKDPYSFEVRHDNRVVIADPVSRILGRRYLSRPTHLGSKDDRDHSLLVKRWWATKCPDPRAARLAKYGEGYTA